MQDMKNIGKRRIFWLTKTTSVDITVAHQIFLELQGSNSDGDIQTWIRERTRREIEYQNYFKHF